MATFEPGFETTHPEIDIRFNFASSGSLRAQIENGAPTDLFISANQDHFQSLADQNLLSPPDGIPLAMNQLVLAVHSRLAEDIRDLNSVFSHIVSQQDRSLAIGEPDSAPVGYYAREALETLNTWETLHTHLIYAKSAQQLLTWINEGMVEAAIIYASDQERVQAEVVVMPFPESVHTPIIYLGGIVNRSDYPHETALLLDYLKSNPAKPVWNQFGFQLLPEEVIAHTY